jgi:hypothetical protein
MKESDAGHGQTTLLTKAHSLPLYTLSLYFPAAGCWPTGDYLLYLSSILAMGFALNRLLHTG